MKTKAEFALLNESFRLELRRRSILLLPIMTGAIIGWVLLAAVAGRLPGNHTVVIVIWVSLFFLLLLSLNFYQAKSQESLARKFELICSSCSRAFGTRALNVIVATHNCPYCGKQVYS